MKIAVKIGFPVFGNEFHHLGNGEIVSFTIFLEMSFGEIGQKKACTFSKGVCFSCSALVILPASV